MNWQAEIAAQFTQRKKTVDAGVVEEMAQHPRPAFEAARADCASARDAEIHAQSPIASWFEGTIGPRRIARAPALQVLVGGASPLAGLALDVRLACRVLRREPAFALLPIT